MSDDNSHARAQAGEPVASYERCPDCNGSGMLWTGEDVKPCPECKGNTVTPAPAQEPVAAPDPEWDDDLVQRAFEIGYVWRGMLIGQTLEDSRAVGRTLGADIFDGLTMDTSGFNSFETADLGICAAKKIIRRALRQAAAPVSPPAEPEGAAQDHLPPGHVVLEQAEMMDGRVSQTVRAPDGSEYERIVHADEAFGPAEPEGEDERASQVEALWFTDRSLPILAISGDDDASAVIKLVFRHAVTNADRDAVIDALNAHLVATHPTAPKPTEVRGLEWEAAPPELQTTRFVAKSEVGTYYVREDAWRPEGCVWLAANGIENAKAAAQADYDERRPSPAPAAEEFRRGAEADLDRDIGILIAQIDWLTDYTGEGLEGEDAALLAQIRADHKARKRPLTSGEG